MMAHLHGRIVYMCDAPTTPPCTATARTGEGRLGTARQIAEAKGWKITRPPDRARVQLRDFCPAHIPALP